MIREKLKNFEFNNIYPLFFTVIFLFLVIQYSFSTFDAIFYDLMIRSDVGTSESQSIVVVTLDEESDEFLGEMYPYTYASHSRFIQKILKDNPIIINYFVQLQDPESEVEEKYFESFKDQLLNYTRDKGHFRFATQMDAWGEQLPPEKLKNIGYSLGILNRDNQAFSRDDVTRRAILNISGEDSLHLWTANKYRESFGSERNEASSFKGAYYNREADATFAMFRYMDTPLSENTNIKSIPYHRVVVGNFPKGFFRNKIVLIGPQYISNSADYSLTPFFKDELKASNMLVHANIIDAFIKDKTVLRVPDIVSDILAIFLALFLSFIISNASPTKGLLMIFMVVFGSFVVAFGLFVLAGMWLKVSHIILCVFLVYYIWVPFRAIGEYQTRYKIQEESKLLKKVDNLKQNFISLMSHDLKTPVAKIHGIADIMMVQYQNSPEQKQHLINITDSTKELNNFISSILDLTKIESRDLELKLITKDINKIVEEIVGKLKYEASTSEIEIDTELAPLYPIQLDSVLMSRVISNLVGNAIKYSGKGSVVKIKTWDDDDWVFIEIKDNGIGIAQEDLENIFDKFYRVKNDSSHKIKGSGLGLYLVRYFIELHSGEIYASSQVGSGTTFTVKLKNA
jgi:signal transduction histidine kinase